MRCTHLCLILIHCNDHIHFYTLTRHILTVRVSGMFLHLVLQMHIEDKKSRLAHLGKGLLACSDHVQCNIERCLRDDHLVDEHIYFLDFTCS